MITIDPDDFSEKMGQKIRGSETMYSVQYALTYRCNVACVHCYAEGASDGAAPELTVDEVRDYFRQFAEAGCLHCTVTGGEPLVRSDFEDIWSAIAEQGIRRLLFTNATLVETRIANFLKQLPPDWIEVTILGADATTHDALTRVPGSFEAALTGIRILEKAGLRVRLKTIAMQGNMHQLGAIRKLAESFGDGSFRLDGQLMGSFRGGIDMDALRIPPEQLAELEIVHGNSMIESWCHEVERLADYERKTLYGCGAARSSAYLSPSGDLHPCLSAEHIAYPLRMTTVHTAWSQMRQDVCNRLLPEDHPCRHCSSFAFCQSCPAVAQLDTGDELGVSAYRCALAKARENVYHLTLKKTIKNSRLA